MTAAQAHIGTLPGQPGLGADMSKKPVEKRISEALADLRIVADISGVSFEYCAKVSLQTFLESVSA